MGFRHRAGRGTSGVSETAVPVPVPVRSSIRKPFGARNAPKDPKATGQIISNVDLRVVLVEMAAKLLARGRRILAPTGSRQGSTLSPSATELG